MHPQGRVAGNRIYYGNYRGGVCSEYNRKKCLLIFFTIMFLLIGLIVTIVGFTLKPFWGESDDWCSFCKEDRLATERNTANCRIVGPIFLGIGVILTVITCYYSHQMKDSIANEGTTVSTASAPTTTTMSYNQVPPPTTTYPGPGTTQAPSYGNNYPQPQQYPPQQYPSQPYPSQPYPPQYPAPQSYPPPPQAAPSAPMAMNPGNMPPPPSYNDVTAGQKF